MKIDSYAVSQTAVSEYYSQTNKVAITQNNTEGGTSLSLSYSNSQTSMTTYSKSFEAYGKYEGTYFPGQGANPYLDETKAQDAGKAKDANKGLLDISDEAKKKSDDRKAQNENLKPAQAQQTGKNQDIPATKEELKIRMLEMILSYLDNNDYGHAWQRIKDRLDSMKQEVHANRGMKKSDGEPAGNKAADNVQNHDGGQQVQNSTQGQSGKWDGISLQVQFYRSESVYESQSMSFSSQGVVKTADGQEVAFNVSLNMSSEYYSFKEEQGSASFEIKFKDPLVINYGGSAASLTNEKFEFDLDADGKMDMISFAGAGSGFLALDKNGDGAINNGSELFGPQSGSGFDDLREYDLDRNGWIDENDEVYSRLKIWSKNEKGEDMLSTLKDMDIGAIYLGDTKTTYAMRDSTYSAQGMIQSTSVFLKDSGGVGTIQHIDIAV